jgi:serine/threonine protein kinase
MFPECSLNVPCRLVGTIEYMAPEVINHVREDDLTLKRAVRPTCATDMWSAGVVLFMLLGGYNPFYRCLKCSRTCVLKNIKFKPPHLLVLGMVRSLKATG